MRIGPFVLCCLFGACLVGCQSLEVRDRWFDSDDESEVPGEVLPIWTDTVLHQPGKPGVRGFGGRLYFYQEGKPDPVRVDGQLAVYVFDGEQVDPDRIAPLRKYVITPEQLKSHYGRSSLGHSYSVWIPWDQVGGETKTLSLVTRFDGSDGGTVLSKPATKMLPGIAGEPLQSSGIQLAEYQATDAGVGTQVLTPGGLDAGASDLATTSIDLPPSFQRRLFGNAMPSHEEARQGDPNRDETDAPTRPDVERTGSFGYGPRATANKAGLGVSAVSRPLNLPAAVEDASATHSSPPRFPARRIPKVQPGPAPLRRQPHPAAWPSALPPIPRRGYEAKSARPQPTERSDGPPPHVGWQQGQQNLFGAEVDMERWALPASEVD